jgi:hypothetical protein
MTRPWLGHAVAGECAHLLRVFIDGVEVADVFEINTDDGWLKRFVRAENGKFLLKEDKPARETLYGNVSAEIIE